MDRLIGVFGIFAFLGIAYLFSNHRKKINPRIIISGLSLQILMALLALGIPALGINGPLSPFFNWFNEIILLLLQFTNSGSEFLFGPLMDQKKYGFIVALQILPVIVFFSSLIGILYHLKVMQVIVYLIGVVMHKLMGTSGAESLSASANIFFGQTEAPLIIKPYINKLTQSELFSVMVGGMATVAGGVFVIYVSLLRDTIPNIASHLLAASVMSAPAALLIAKIMIPETQKTETSGNTPLNISKESPSHNMIEAAARGATDGLQLALNVGAMLLAFIALIALLNSFIGSFGEIIDFNEWGHHLVPDLLLIDGKAPPLSLSIVLGWIFAPIAWLMGIPWNDLAISGSLLGQKIVINEFVAYLELSKISAQLNPKTSIILSYALCGFANFSSIAIQIGGIGGIAPKRQSDLAQLGIRAIIGGSLAAFMTAAIAGILL